MRAPSPARDGLVVAALAFAAAACGCAAAPLAIIDAARLEGTLSDGARYVVERPANWNGVLLLYAHGYAPRASATAPETAPRGLETMLLARGYGLAASSYAAPGWALDTAPADQLGAAQHFAAAYGRPRLTIAWGESMGGLVTAALAERINSGIDGAFPMCGSVGGAVGMMNMALDGAFVVKTLLAPDDPGIRLVGIADDRANGRAVAAVLATAQATPTGRARIALAATLAGLPPWTDPETPEPAKSDAAAAEAEQAKSFVMGVFLPRSDQETRAGGVFSWNDGVDYTAQLDRSGRRAEVAALYRAAGLDLSTDLTTLAHAPRIHADAKAVAWMKANFTPTGRLNLPVLTLHTIGDGLTSPTLERGYGDTARAAGRMMDLRQAYVAHAGHCNFLPAEALAGLDALQFRLRNGQWGALDADDLSARAIRARAGAAAFIDYTPTPFLRPCAGDRTCAGEPTSRAGTQP